MKTIARTTAILLSLCLLAADGASAQGDYQSITEIKQSTPERWQETYETQWRTINIDTAIEVPDVAQFPIIRIVLLDAVDESLLTGYRKIEQNVNGNLRVIMGPPTHVIANNEKIRQNEQFYNGKAPDIQPENNPLTCTEALKIVTDECARLFGDVELSVTQVGILGRVYRYKSVNGQREWLDPVTEKGYYFIDMAQGFRGIDYEESTECYDVLGLSHESSMANTSVCFLLYDSGCYSAGFALHQELDEIEADVPILPFADAKAAVETEIMAGHLRSVDEIKLCYAPYYDPDDDSILWLLPVWYVKGAYTRNPNREFTPWTGSTGTVVDSGVEYREVVYQAQLGTLMDYDDSRASRRKAPDILTWDDIN